MAHQKLSKPPVVEAVIEIRVSVESPADVGRLLTWRERLKPEYPIGREIRSIVGSFGVQPSGDVKQEIQSSRNGVRLEPDDGKWVIQGRLDALAVSRLSPYSDFESLIERTKSVWHSYVDAVRATAVLRLGVRYINRIEFGGDSMDLDQVLVAGPHIPPTLPQYLTDFFSRIVVPMPEANATVAIVQTFDDPSPTPQSRKPALVLDIDASSEESLPVDSDKIWVQLHKLRIAKNTAFFGSLTEKQLAAFT